MECLSLENILPVALQVKVREETLWVWEIPMMNLMSCDVSPPPWGLLVGQLESLGGKGVLGWSVIL